MYVHPAGGIEASVSVSVASRDALEHFSLPLYIVHRDSARRTVGEVTRALYERMYFIQETADRRSHYTDRSTSHKSTKASYSADEVN